MHSVVDTIFKEEESKLEVHKNAKQSVSESQ